MEEYKAKSALETIQLETNLSAKFIPMIQPNNSEQIILDELNTHAEQCAEILQSVFRKLVIEMLELKRSSLQGGEHAGSNQTDIPSNDCIIVYIVRRIK
jgi:hypothetical protein